MLWVIVQAYTLFEILSFESRARWQLTHDTDRLRLEDLAGTVPAGGRSGWYRAPKGKLKARILQSMISGIPNAQRAQSGLIQELSLNYIGIHNMIEGIFLN